MFLTFTALIFWGCTELEEQPARSQTEEPDMELYHATVRMSRAGQSMFTLDAGYISQIERDRHMALDSGVKVDFFDEFGNHSAVLTSEKGDIYDKEQRLVARGDVIVRSDSGMVLYADELYYNEKDARVLSDGFVTVITQNDSLSGYGFSAASDLSDWVIKNTSGATWRDLKKSEPDQ